MKVCSVNSAWSKSPGRSGKGTRGNIVDNHLKFKAIE